MTDDNTAGRNNHARAIIEHTTANREVPYFFRTVGPSRMGWTDRMNSVK